MKNYNLLFLAIMFLTYLSCNKNKDCNLMGTGKIKIENESIYEHEITVDMDSTFLIQPGGETTFTATVGEHSLIAQRTDPFGAIIPTSGWNPTVSECKTVNLVID